MVSISDPRGFRRRAWGHVGAGLAIVGSNQKWSERAPAAGLAAH
jgi:hypothetical protein